MPRRFWGTINLCRRWETSSERGHKLGMGVCRDEFAGSLDKSYEICRLGCPTSLKIVISSKFDKNGRKFLDQFKVKWGHFESKIF